MLRRSEKNEIVSPKCLTLTIMQSSLKVTTIIAACRSVPVKFDQFHLIFHPVYIQQLVKIYGHL